MSVIVNILAAFGLIIIFVYVFYYLYQYVVKKMKQKIISNINPPGSYMQSSGIRCPDYWVNTGVDRKGNYICKNSFNIQTNNECDSNNLLFPPVEDGFTWEYGNPNGLTSYSDEQRYNFLNNRSSNKGSLTRCQWINKCGPINNVQGVWSGINEVCNNPQMYSS